MKTGMRMRAQFVLGIGSLGASHHSRDTYRGLKLYYKL
jgi:hypothetical protein